MTTCPECNAPLVNGFDCWGQLGALIALEMYDPELAAVHFLTVACYNFQHPAQFTDDALTNLRDIFIDHLDNGTSVTYLRRKIAQAAAGPTRVRKPKADRHPTLRHWPVTIADVYRPDHPQNTADRVRHWAATIRATLTNL